MKGPDYRTIWAIGRDAGIALCERGGRAPIPKNVRKKIVAKLRATPNASQVARDIGHFSVTAICKIARQEGIALAPRRPPKPINARAAAVGKTKKNTRSAALH